MKTEYDFNMFLSKLQIKKEMIFYEDTRGEKF